VLEETFMGEVIPVTVYVAQGLLEANVVKAKLESEGIPVVLQYDSSNIIFGISIDSLGEVKILVPPAMEKAARSILQEAEDEGGEGAEEAEESSDSDDPTAGADG
jgi:hypothetical protein